MFRVCTISFAAKVERAIDEAVNPKGMSVHDGKARIGSDKLAYMLKLIDILSDRLKAAQPVPHESLGHETERSGEAVRRPLPSPSASE
jgi:hypothetical protein